MNGRILKGDVWVEIFRQRNLRRREVKSRAGGVNPARLFCSAYAAGKEVTYWWHTASNACSMQGYNNE